MCLHTSVASAACPSRSNHLGDSGMKGRKKLVQMAGMAHAATKQRHPQSGRRTIARKHVRNWPTGQKSAILKRLIPRVSNGKNSEKSAKSTEMLPPYPKPTMARSNVNTAMFGARAEARPKTTTINVVTTNTRQRPNRSAKGPHDSSPRMEPAATSMGTALSWYSERFHTLRNSVKANPVRTTSIAAAEKPSPHTQVKRV
mmetsp:Transcript_55913/g.130931  ORF Transcript_55913/g.130931 Transcript_55913/m.130931 type:complete len:200 (-) Transcript_55913:195-794(-)